VTSTLGYDVLILMPIAQNVDALVPNGDRYMWSPQSTILIHGERDAVLVDLPFTTEQGGQVADWIRASGKNLTHVVATHGHGDHWFTAPVLAEEFGAQVVASQGTIDLMRQQVELGCPLLWPDRRDTSHRGRASRPRDRSGGPRGPHRRGRPQ
jgi:glyoxylase-like metal-dependent hydrolase (beta-lactamase superfamily II)